MTDIQAKLAEQKTNRNFIIYQFAKSYLEDMIKDYSIDLNSYFIGDNKGVSSLREIFIGFISSAQNYQSMPNIIQFNTNVIRRKMIGEILCDFDYTQIKDKSPKNLYYLFRDAFNVNSKDSKRNSWYKWSCAIVDSAKFVSDFADKEDFDSFVELFNYNVTTRMALPLLISKKIRGIGFALSCDLLKELGYINYPKPDVHLMDVFSALKLSENEPVSTFEAIVRMADECKTLTNDSSITPYKVDKTIWLICSGKFYLERPELSLGRHKEKFIKEALPLIDS